MTYRSAILNAGYKVSMSHTSPTSIKTNAPLEVIWDIMRVWVSILHTFNFIIFMRKYVFYFFFCILIHLFIRNDGFIIILMLTLRYLI